MIAFQRAGVKGLKLPGNQPLIQVGRSYTPFLHSSPFHRQCCIDYICILRGKHVCLLCVTHPVRVGSAEQGAEDLHNLYQEWPAVGCSYYFGMYYFCQVFVVSLIH